MSSKRRKSTPWRLRLFRALVLLSPSEPPLPGPIATWTEPVDFNGKELLELHTRTKEPDERIADEIRWHKDGLRGEIAWQLWRITDLRWSGNKIRNLVSRRTSRFVNQHRLLRARSICIKSHYYLEADRDCEVFLEVDGRQVKTLAIYPRNMMAEYVTAEKEYSLSKGYEYEPVCSRSSIYFGEWIEWIAVPEELLHNELILEIVKSWYRDLVEYKRGHWTHLEQSQPEFTIDVEWTSSSSCHVSRAIRE